MEENKNQKRTCPEPSRRKRSGQPGNNNERTHASHAEALSSEDRQTLEAAAAMQGLEYEIALLRAKALNILAREPVNYELLLMALTALTQALKAKNRLLDDSPDGLSEAVQNRLKAAAESLRLGSLEKILSPGNRHDSESAAGEAYLRNAGGRQAPV